MIFIAGYIIGYPAASRNHLSRLVFYGYPPIIVTTNGYGARLMTKRIPVELLVVDVLTLVLVPVIVLLPESVFRIILGLPFALFFPGYAMVAAVFPGHADAGDIMRFTLGVAASFALTAIVGIVLNYTPLGIDLYPMLYTLTALTLAASLVAWYRWLRLPPDARYVIPFDLYKDFFKGGKLDRMLSLLVAMAFVIALVVLIYSVWLPKTGERFTEIYVLGEQGQASDYVLDLEEGGTGSVTLGIINQEGRETDYTVVIKMPGETEREIARVVLQDEETWEQNVEFSIGTSSEYNRIEFLVFRGDEAEPYRSVHVRTTIPGNQ
jgi:uncharacterized membrane protein